VPRVPSPSAVTPYDAFLIGGPGALADFELIEKVADLETVAADLAREPVLGFDTEADSFYHYFDKTCLVQVATRRRIFLLDPIAMGGPASLAPLAPLFADPDIRTIFHAADYDLYVLKRDCSFRFSGLFDTMISAQLLGYPAIGLAAIAERHFDLRLPKDEQRSDWSLRPLRESQLQYAAADVEHLISLAEKLERELRRLKRLHWAEQEFRALERREWPEREFDKLGYLRIKGARALDPQSLSVLRELYIVRDRRAREIDRPSFKVLGNRTLLEIAERQPVEEADLAAMKGVTELILRRFGRDILLSVQRGLKKAHGPIPRLEGAVSRRRMDRRAERRLVALKRWRAGRAQELALDPGVLCPNTALEAIALENAPDAAVLARLPEVKPWFAESFGDEIVAALRSADAHAA
jgi:ribonuclease D